LQECIQSFLRTRNITAFDWEIIIADDGSDLDHLQLVEEISFKANAFLIKNQRRYAVGQTNTILNLIVNLGFDLAFIADDDIIFKNKGWDGLYYDAVKHTKLDHLCFLDLPHYLWNRKKESPNTTEPLPYYNDDKRLVSYTNVEKCMGALFTITPRMLKTLGSCDEVNFPIRGQWHIDYSARACRAGFNNSDHFFDINDSNKYITLQNNIKGEDNYKCSIPWNAEYKSTKDSIEIERRYKILADSSRLFVGPAIGTFEKQRQNLYQQSTLNSFFDKIFAINLDRRCDRWRSLISRCNQANVEITRFPACDGNSLILYNEWKSYIQEPLDPVVGRRVTSSKEYYLDYDTDEARIEYITNFQNGKKPLASPGSWGYLKTIINILETAIQKDYEQILILDDDVLLHKDFDVLAEKVFAQLPSKWKILQFGALQYDWEGWIDWFSENLYMCNGSSIASHAVGIHKSVYVELLYYCRKILMPFDEGALHKIKHKYKTQCFVCMPNLFIQDVSESDINTSLAQGSEGLKSDNVYRWVLSDYMDNLHTPSLYGIASHDAFSASIFKSKFNSPRILHIRESFSAPSETFIYDLLLRLERQTIFDNYLLTFERLLEDERPFDKVLLLDRKKLSAEQQIEQFKNILNIIQPELIVCHFGTSAFDLYNLMGDQISSYPILVSMHGYDLYEFPLQVSTYSQVIQKLASLPSVHFTCPTQYVFDKLEEYLAIPAEKKEIMNNVANNRFDDVLINRRTQNIDSANCFHVLNIARLVPWKGHDYLIEGFVKFKNIVKDNAKLSIVGCKGSLRDYYDTKIANLGMQNSITIFDYLDDLELQDLLLKADVYVQPSYVDQKSRMTESFGVAALEAIYTGLPVICSKAGGLPELVGFENDWAQLIDSKSSTQICEALLKIYSQKLNIQAGDKYIINRKVAFSAQNQLMAFLSAINKIRG
jgi:glycosyltransferase involved in cell wall biosynthesis/GR25 family glycosyltransferase involved in LPS biosynthesis